MNRAIADAWRELAWSTGWVLCEALEALEPSARAAVDMERMIAARAALVALREDTIDPHPPAGWDRHARLELTP